MLGNFVWGFFISESHYNSGGKEVHVTFCKKKFLKRRDECGK